MTSPLTLSVAMATFNGERFLSEQLQSLSRQTRLPDELVITDDGSSDGTLAIVESFAATSPFPVRIYRNPEPLGYGDNFLRAASLCQGELIAFADQDDVWMPNKIAHSLPFFSDSEVMLSVHAGTVVDEHLNPLGYRHPDISCTRVEVNRTLFRHALPGFAMIIRKDLPGLFHTPRAPNLSNNNPMPHDTWAGFLASTFGKAAFIQESLVWYRRHQTTTTKLSHFSTLQQIKIANQTTADGYGKSARWTSELIASLNHIPLGTRQDQDQRQRQRQIAVNILERHRQALESRALLYGSSIGFLPKLRLLASLVYRGNYGDAQEGNLGWKSLLKDSANLFLALSRPG